MAIIVCYAMNTHTCSNEQEQLLNSVNCIVKLWWYIKNEWYSAPICFKVIWYTTVKDCALKIISQQPLVKHKLININHKIEVRKMKVLKNDQKWRYHLDNMNIKGSDNIM